MKRGYFSFWRTRIHPTIHISVGVPGLLQMVNRLNQNAGEAMNNEMILEALLQ